MDELVGRLSFVSRFPQYLKPPIAVSRMQGGDEMGQNPYLTTAMFTGAVVVARYTFSDAIVVAAEISSPSE